MHPNFSSAHWKIIVFSALKHVGKNPTLYVKSEVIFETFGWGDVS